MIKKIDEERMEALYLLIKYLQVLREELKYKKIISIISICITDFMHELKEELELI